MGNLLLGIWRDVLGGLGFKTSSGSALEQRGWSAGRWRTYIELRVGVEENVGKKWKFKQAFEGYRLATSNDNFYASSGAISVPAHPGASRHIGNELDLVAEYMMNKGLSFGFGYARLFAGQFLKTTTPGHDYSYPYAYVEYNFSKSGFHFPITPNKPD